MTAAVRRVLLIHNFLTPYRIPLFSELAKRFDLDLWILGDVRKIRDWPPDVPKDAFRYRELAHMGCATGSRDYRVLVNYTLPLELPRHECDAIINCGWDTPAAFYASGRCHWRRKPLVLWSGSTHGEPSWRRTVSRPMVRWLVSCADAWLAYGSRSEDYLVSLGAERSRVRRAYNTVDGSAFANAAQVARENREEIRARLGINTPHVVFYCGQLIPRKGLQDLLQALGILSPKRQDITLLVVGSGSHEREHRELARKLGLEGRVVFLGFLPRQELPQYYAACDLFALPSREEVWGLVINEALACGAPVLTTQAVGAAPDLIQQGVNGYVSPPGDPRALAEALDAHFSLNSDQRANMSGAARESISVFTIPRMADAFEEAVEIALGRR